MFYNVHACATSLQSCPTLCNTMNCSLPGSAVHGILQARTLEYVAMPSSRGSFQPRDWTHVCYVSWTGRWGLHHYHHHTQLGKGVHQGCILSPCSFNLYAEYIMRNAGLNEGKPSPQPTVQMISQPTVSNVNEIILDLLVIPECFPGGASGKEPACQCRRL